MSKALDYMGLARRAGKLVIGHDASLLSVRQGRASAVLLTQDASPRHKRELDAAGFGDRVVFLGFTMAEAGYATGKKSCIYAVEDEGFADAIKNTLLKEGIANNGKV